MDCFRKRNGLSATNGRGGGTFSSGPMHPSSLTAKVAAAAAVLGMLGLNGLPQPYHPVFNVPHFVEASRDRFFIMILSRDPRFDMVGTKEFMATLEPLAITVPLVAVGSLPSRV